MNATVFVEITEKNTYRASTSQPVPLETEAQTQDEALKRLYELASKRMAGGKVYQMNLTDSQASNPWRTVAATWKDHPDFDDFLENIAEYRRSLDEEGSPA